MYILSLDSTAKTASVCISRYSDGVLMPLSRSQVNCTLTHSESLLPMIDSCLTLAGLQTHEIDACAVSAGPGSFTGVRIGISVVKGFAFGRNLPCYAVSTLAALAQNLCLLPEGTLICSVMDARRHQFYTALFEIRDGSVHRITTDSVLQFDEIGELLQPYGERRVVFTGDGAELYRQLSKDTAECADLAYRYQSAYSVARCAVDECISKGVSGCAPEALLPLYLRASQAERERNAE